MRRASLFVMLACIALFCLSSAASAQATAINVNSLLSNVPYGPTPVNLHVTSDSGTPSGYFNFSIDGGSSQSGPTLDNNGDATVNLPAMNVGSHSVEFDFTGTNGYSNSSTTAQATVVQDTIGISINTDTNSVAYGSGPNVSVTISGGPHYGVLSYWADGTQLMNQSPFTQFSSIFPSTTIPAGTHNLYVRFDSLDGNTAAGMSNSVQVVVAQGTPQVFLNATPNPAQEGTALQLNSTIEPSPGVAGAPPTGSVDFSEGATDFGTVQITVNGFGTSFANLPLPNGLPAGTHVITASYSGDSNYVPGSVTWTETVNPTTIPTTTVLNTDSGTYIYNQPIQVTAAVSSSNGTPTGSVAVDEGQNPLGSITLGSNGQGATTINPGLSAGSHTLTGIYQPTGSFLQSTGTASISVNQASPNVQPTGPSIVTGGQAFSYTVVISGPFGGTATGSVAVSDSSNSLGTFPISNNSASCSITLNSGVTHTLTFAYSGDSNFTAGSATAAVTVHYLTPPTISNVPAPITVDATSAAGAVVTYSSPTATDLNDGTDPVLCSPASGSTFPMGTTTVTCTATDSLGQSSTATFTVTVLAPLPMNQSILNVLKGITLPNSTDETTLKAAITQLTNAGAAANWTSNSRLVQKTGGNVYNDWQTAANDLTTLITKPKGAVPTSTLVTQVNRVANVARDVALVVMSTCTNATKLSAAKSALAKGDTALASKQYGTAISDYKSAWSNAFN